MQLCLSLPSPFWLLSFQMQSCSNELGVPVNCILPVKNYHEETQGNNDIDALLLQPMTQIVEVANDYIWHVQQKKKHLS